MLPDERVDDSDRGFLLAFSCASGLRTRAVAQPWNWDWVGYPVNLIVESGFLFMSWSLTEDIMDEGPEASAHVGVHIHSIDDLRRLSFLPGGVDHLTCSGQYLVTECKGIVHVYDIQHLESIQVICPQDVIGGRTRSRVKLNERLEVNFLLLHRELLYVACLLRGNRTDRHTVQIQVWDFKRCSIEHVLHCPTGGPMHMLFGVTNLLPLGDKLFCAFNAGDFTRAMSAPLKAYLL